MNKAELARHIEWYHLIEDIERVLRSVSNDKPDQILALCEPYYREIAKEAVLEPYTHNSDAADYEERCVMGFRHAVLKAIDDAMGGA